MEHTKSENKLIEIRQHSDKSTVTISVRDQGPGVDPAIKEKLFQPFVTSRESGFGIGLAVSRSIIDRHNGKIWTENIEGGGAEFSFRIQIVKI